MAPRSEIEKLTVAWSALVAEGEKSGARLIPIASGKAWRVLAGRQYPANEEVLLVGFSGAVLPADKVLPQGRGFAVAQLRSAALDANFRWLQLVRSPGSNLDFFTLMSGDVCGILSQTGDAMGGQRTAVVFIQRVAAWQDFMAREGTTRLSDEAETGLFGELAVLEAILDAGVSPLAAVSSWVGPTDALHDFGFAAISIEVKTTLMKERFPAHVFCLEQLDDQPGRILYVAAVRLEESGTAKTVIEYARALKARIVSSPEALSLLGTRLILGGLNDADSEKYSRRFGLRSILLIEVDRDFPRLTRSGTRAEILEAKYQLDLSYVEARGGLIRDIAAVIGGIA